jgi:hypothetical protein
MVMNDKIGPSGASPPTGSDDGAAPLPEADDLVRPGDEHVNGTESLCVGESQ